MAQAIVIGGGAGAVRAAGALARAGRDVVLVQEGGDVAGLAHPEVPTGTGLSRFVSPPAGWRLTPAVTSGVMLGRDCRCVRTLPLSRSTLPGIFSASELPSAFAAWARSRSQVELSRLIGGGKETRFYKDWVVQHFGEPVYNRLYAPYCQRRFGDPAELTVNVARSAHAAGVGEWCGREIGPAHELADALSGVELALNAVVTGVSPGKVTTTNGVYEGEVYFDLPPVRLVELLGSASPPGLANEVSRLRCRHALEVTVSGGHALPVNTHVVDGPLPFYRLVRHGMLPGNGHLCGTVCVQFALEDHDALWSLANVRLVAQVVAALQDLGLDDVSDGDARVQRVANHHPVWAYTHHARMRQYALRLSELALTPVGRAGLFAPIEGQAEAAFLADIAGESVPIRELFRRHVDPPVVDDDGSASLADFVLG